MGIFLREAGDVGKIPVVSRQIESVAHDEPVRNVESHKVSLKVS